MSNMLSITVDLSGIIGAQGVITREIFPRLREAVGAVAQEAQNRWADSIMKAPGVWYVEKQEYVDAAREQFGDKAASEVDFLLEKNSALFAGGDLSQEAKDDFFAAVMKAYLTCKDEAKKTYGRKKPKVSD